MRQKNEFAADMLDFDTEAHGGDILWVAGVPEQSEVLLGGIGAIDVPFFACSPGTVVADPSIQPKAHRLFVRAYGDDIVRLTINASEDSLPDDGQNPMLEWDRSLRRTVLSRTSEEGRLKFLDADKRVRFQVESGTGRRFRAVVFPDGKTAIPFASDDTYSADRPESVPLGFSISGTGSIRCVYSLRSQASEHFAGTGERFSRLDLAGQTLVLENTDAQGVNSRRAYKNIPFFVSSRPYGLLVLTSATVRLSLADISTRSAQALVDAPLLDLFFFGGRRIGHIIRGYQRVTGFPRAVPLWSYGIWMSRTGHSTAEEVEHVASRLRIGELPCDVLHVDTGWFAKDRECDWEFDGERFPDPAGFMRRLRASGFRTSLWQLPRVAPGTHLYEKAATEGFLLSPTATRSAPDHVKSADAGFRANIDFTSADAYLWYGSLLSKLFDLGAAAIASDFGEEIDLDTPFRGEETEPLRNLYALLYQHAVHEASSQKREEPISWSRAGWTGCQRYPVHGSGSSACDWEGFSAVLRGGLHLGLSGFAFWGHDVPGFHGLPDFMNSPPADDLYVRWTQFGVFSSHIRYHGTNAREPWEFSRVTDTVQKWWRFRYAIIPYLVEEGMKATRSGYPVLRALVFHHQDDPVAWHVDDQFYCGDRILVAPVANSSGVRDVYLPEGSWTDLWTGHVVLGPIYLRDQRYPLSRIPVFVRTGATIPVYPERVSCTDEIDPLKTVRLSFNEAYHGISGSVLGRITGLS